MTQKYNYKIAALILAILILTIFFLLKARQPSKLNVILITLDALRQDHLGCYGYALNTSPNIDGLAKEATLFTQAITQGSKTSLALASLFTSTYPRTHGCYNEGHKINSSLPTLAQKLKESNYTTVAIVNNVSVGSGLERGFDIFTDCGVKRAEETTSLAIKWLEKNRTNQFFLWLHYFEPHGPYRPPFPYNVIFLDKLKLGRRNVPICSKMFSCDKGIPLSIAENNVTDVDYYISQYDGEIRFADEQIGRLLRELKKLKLDKNSIIILTADHGELLGEHEIYFEHSTLYDQTLKVPLLIKYDRIIPASKIIKDQVRLIDVAPTILALLDLPKDKHMQGENLLPLILGKADNHSMHAFSEKARPKIDLIIECVRTEEWKLIYLHSASREGYKLYNLKYDPGESNDLINTNNEEFQTLKKIMDNWRKTIPISKPEFFPLSEEDKSRLRNLGYLQ